MATEQEKRDLNISLDEQHINATERARRESNELAQANIDFYQRNDRSFSKERNNETRFNRNYR